MKFGSLFSGIGGFDLGLEQAGMECAWQVEIDEWCTRVLVKHWPNIPKYKDVKDVGKENLETVDLIAGGFPCQPFSVAGKRKGTADDRHLWPEMLRVIAELKPTWVIGENVPGIIKIFLDQAISDLENEGYTCEPFVLPACAFDAPHRRDRLFIVAYSKNKGASGWQRIKGNGTEQSQERGINGTRSGTNSGGEVVADTERQGLAERKEEGQFDILLPIKYIGDNGRIWTIEPNVGRVANGVPHRVDRLRGLGNAVVPQVARFIGEQIMEVA